MRILIVEDDDALRRGYERLLRDEGYEICWATNAQNAIKLMRGEAPDLVLLDMMLDGGSSGLEVLRAKYEDPTLMGIAIVILTGLTVEQVRAKARVDSILSGATLIVEKPVDGDHLVSTIRRVLGI